MDRRSHYNGLGFNWQNRSKGLNKPVLAAAPIHMLSSRPLLYSIAGGFLIAGVLLALSLWVFGAGGNNGQSSASHIYGPGLQASPAATEDTSAQPQQPAQSGSSTSVNLNTQSHNGNSSASLQVDGQNVPVVDPDNIHQTITSSDGTSTIKIDVHNSSSSGKETQ